MSKKFELKRCPDCPMFTAGKDTYICGINKNEILKRSHVIASSRSGLDVFEIITKHIGSEFPEWCPLPNYT